MLWQTHSAGLPTHRVSRHVPATRPRPLAPSGMWEEGMWSDAEREDGMWSDAERAMDILKWSRRPLLSFFLSFFFLPHATTCLSPFSNRSILPQPIFSCPVSAATGCRPCPCPVSAAAARRSCPVRSCPRPPPCAVPVLSDPVLGHRRAPTSSLSRYPKPCRPGRYKGRAAKGRSAVPQCHRNAGISLNRVAE